MDGISGVFDFGRDRPVDRRVLEGMIDVQRHRGRAGKAWARGRVGLASRHAAGTSRPAGGPISNDAGTVWIACSGEVFNRDEVRRDLERRGQRLENGTDAGLLLGAYEAYGASWVHRINGQFALALWDEARGHLVLARDPLGICPLHYAIADGQLVFGSEAKSVLAHPAVRTAIDEEGVAEALLCGTLFEGRTLFTSVRRLDPGTTLTVSPSGCRRSVYWTLPRGGEAPPEAEARCGEALLPLLEDAVRLRTGRDADWGIMLSGGTDSSALAALARRTGDGPVRTFSIDFPDAWKGTEVDAHYARLVAGRLGTSHRTFMAGADEYYAVLERLAWHVERPYNKAAATVYLLCGRLSAHAAAALSGEGMDEMLAGYAGARGLGMDGARGDGRLATLPWAPYSASVGRLLSEDFRTRVRPLEIAAQRVAECAALTEGDDGLSGVLHLYMRYFLVDLLELHEQSAAAAGVTIRLPFLDRRLVEMLAALPPGLKLRDGETKYVFKKVVGPLIPEEVLHRRKTHLPMPRDPAAMRTQLAMARELLLGPGARSAGYYDRGRLEDLVEGRDPEVDALTAWQVTMNLITLELLHRRFGV